MEEAWIDRLPQDVLQRVIPLETPRDACRAAAVSPAFRAIADSDVVWGKFQPDDSSLQLADGHVVGQGDRGQVLYALGQSAGDYHWWRNPL
ncbi:F-box protein PP2-B3 [Oryza sativa Japonica Group]|uniref:F-box protein PP2-B3 n=1 Tax=Oryza sativa subsp. japonica TaxID=39947 RepID=UPI0001C7D73D|nr:F-box domain-containing protein [Oryza sativa Japonica Group]